MAARPTASGPRPEASQEGGAMFFFHPATPNHHADLPARHDRPGRSLLPALCLVTVMALGGMLTFPVAATSEPAPPDPTPTNGQSAPIPKGAAFGLELTPANPGIKNDDVIWLGESRTYKAEAVVTLGGREFLREEVTDLPGFKLTVGRQARMRAGHLHARDGGRSHR